MPMALSAFSSWLLHQLKTVEADWYGMDFGDAAVVSDSATAWAKLTYYEELLRYLQLPEW